VPVAIQLFFQAVFIFCVAYAVVSDFRQLLIPNWIPVSLVAAFALYAALKLDSLTILHHLGIAGVVFLLMVGFFAAGWIAGGDVKLLTAVMLWMGPGQAAPFALLMAVFGSLLALALIGLKKYGFLVRHYLPANGFLDHLHAIAGSGQCPYGVAIGAAALLSANQILWA
jgi:prepilin peptidase CpaA